VRWCVREVKAGFVCTPLYDIVKGPESRSFFPVPYPRRGGSLGAPVCPWSLHIRAARALMSSSAASEGGSAGGGAGAGAVAGAPLQPRYAELRRVSREVPCTATLPDEITLQQPGDSVEDVLTIGRHRLNSVQLDCTRVPSLLSRQHAEIKLEPDGVHNVTDKNTLNGTYLNGNLIPKGPCPLQHGDVVAFGGPANVSPDPPLLSLYLSTPRYLAPFSLCFSSRILTTLTLMK
jgi:hypothetical protein